MNLWFMPIHSKYTLSIEQPITPIDDKSGEFSVKCFIFQNDSRLFATYKQAYYIRSIVLVVFNSHWVNYGDNNREWYG